MNNMFYLLNLTVSGVKNLKKEVRLDFYKKTIDKNFDPQKYRLKAIYGENGSGKSAIVTAVKIFQDLILNDNYLSESKNQNFLEEIINKETKKFKFNCEYMFLLESQKRIYNYTIYLGKNGNDQYEIEYEKLMLKNGNYPNNNYKTLYECHNGEIDNIELEDKDKDYVIKKTMNLLSTKSLVYLCIANLRKDVAKSGNDDSYNELIVSIIVSIAFVLLIKVYLAEEDQHELYFWRKKLKESGIDNELIGKGLLELGESINFYLRVDERKIEKTYYKKYEQKVGQLTDFIKLFKPELVSIEIDKRDDGDQYICELILNYGSYQVNKEFESTGIKKLIRLYDCLMAASTKGIVFIDEMDSNLNDVYLCRLIEYFMYYGKGQLCFTTHNLDPMTVLKDNKNSIEFLSSDNNLVQWTTRGNSSPDNCYRNGMIEDSPFNIDATDFIGIFGE